MSLEDLKAELLRSEFPSLRPDHDPDIERYFDMRTSGRPAEALSFYESRIKPRYPDNEHRTAALRAYRLKDPSYPAFIRKAYTALGDQLLERTKRTIKYVAMYASSYDRKDAYATIRAAEAILRMLPRDRFEAVAAVERLRRHADLLRYQERELLTAEELVRSYLNEQLDVVEAERVRRLRERERSLAERRSLLVEQDKAETAKAMKEARLRKAKHDAAGKRAVRSPAKRSAVLDLSTIRFSAADLARIQIPPTLTKIEDKTLAFCFKYWNLTEDRSFERVLFLYARKYGVKHYDIFSIIRDGKRRGRRDEEILATVSGLLISGYYYSIRGDIYLQRSWARLKAKLEQPSVPQIARDETERPRQPKRPRGPRTARQRRPSVSRPGDGQPAAGRNAAGRNAAETIDAPSIAAAKKKRPPAENLKRSGRSRKERNAAPPTRANRPRKTSAAVRTVASAQAAPPSVDARTPRGSVSDRLKKLSGKSYDVFQERFLSKARAAIRSVLSETKTGKKALFPSIPQEAEDQLFAFLKENYENPFMDWESSEARRRTAELGYELVSIDKIIDDCYRRL